MTKSSIVREPTTPYNFSRAVQGKTPRAPLSMAMASNLSMQLMPTERVDVKAAYRRKRKA